MSNPPLLVVSTDILDFGKLPLDYTATRKIQLVNAGNQQLVIDSATIEGGDAAFMTLPTETTIAGGDSIEFAIAFTPTEIKNYEAVLTLMTNSRNNAEATVSLLGEGFKEVICGDCNSPPDDYCSDSETLAIYTADGECVEDVCRYVPTFVDCPYGCLDATCQPAPDADADGILDDDDNCVSTPNPQQEDEDEDGVGDVCDNCPSIPNADQTDSDEDGHGEPGDNCVDDANPQQEDGDEVGIGNVCDQCPRDDGNDIDEDGICDSDDNCPSVPNAYQIDSNHNGVGDRCELYLTVGTNAACVKDMEGAVVCWGTSNIVSQVSQAATDYIQIDTGMYHGCGVRQNQEIQCWGSGTTDTGVGDSHGQAIAPEGEFLMVNSNTHHNCAVRVDGEVHCWGEGASSPAGTTFESLYADIPEGPFVDVQVGYRHACALRASGEMLCWGGGSGGEDSAVSELSIQSFSLAPYQNCALDTTGTTICWGTGYNSGFDDIPEGPLAKISVSYWHACGLRTNPGTAVCWGAQGHNQNFGQLTLPNATRVYWDVVAAQKNSCAFRMDNTIDCWGESNAIQNSVPEIYKPLTNE